MATKQNMYVGKIKQAKKIIYEINECVIAWKLNDSGINEIAIFQTDKVESIRNDVANMQGKLEVLLSGLDQNSAKRKEYQNLLDKINSFMDLFE